MNLIARINRRMKREIALQKNRLRVWQISNTINQQFDCDSAAPVIFFNASTRLSGISQNAGFSLIASMALRMRNIPVHQFVCDHGLRPCVLGTNRDNPGMHPPCRECVRTSRYLFTGNNTHWFTEKLNPQIEDETQKLDLSALLSYEYQHIPLGRMILPSLRWILRKHHLDNDTDTRFLARSYIQSAWNVYAEFSLLVESLKPQAVVVFNGMFYPEAMARLAAGEKSVPVYSHEVGMLPYSAFFTDKEATAYPVKVDSDFELNAEQNARLDTYLTNRFQGNFQTAGVAFWPEMKRLDNTIMGKVSEYGALVPIFTNVIFDTSQAHANKLFRHMFDWLDMIVEKIKVCPDTLFIIRAHPDEVRPGKESYESVAEWYEKNNLAEFPNLIFIPPDEFISSYELIRRSKFVMVYNSTVGLEASLMGKPVLCAGKARYTQIPTVYFPESRSEYEKHFDSFLREELIDQPKEFIKNARKVLYSQLFRASIPFDQYLEADGVWKGYVRLKEFDIHALRAENSDVIKVVTDGMLDQKPFIRDL